MFCIHVTTILVQLGSGHLIRGRMGISFGGDEEIDQEG